MLQVVGLACLLYRKVYIHDRKTMLDCMLLHNIMPDNTLVCGVTSTAAASNFQTADPTCSQAGNWFSRVSNLKKTQAMLYIVCPARLAVHVVCVAA